MTIYFSIKFKDLNNQAILIIIYYQVYPLFLPFVENKVSQLDYDEL